MCGARSITNIGIWAKATYVLCTLKYTFKRVEGSVMPLLRSMSVRGKIFFKLDELHMNLLIFDPSIRVENDLMAGGEQNIISVQN